MERTQYTLGYLFEHRFNDVWTVRQNFRYLYVGEEMDLVFPIGGQPDLRPVDRGAFLDREHLDAITLDNQGQATFDTGLLQHTLLCGLDYQRAIRDRRFGAAPLAVASQERPVTGDLAFFLFGRRRLR